MENIHNTALDLANKSLVNHFDATAYIVKCLAEDRIDKVPESQVDENIDTMQDMFLIYMRNRTSDNLKKVLNQSVQIVAELYQNSADKSVFTEYRQKITTLIK